MMKVSGHILVLVILVFHFFTVHAENPNVSWEKSNNFNIQVKTNFPIKENFFDENYSLKAPPDMGGDIDGGGGTGIGRDVPAQDSLLVFILLALSYFAFRQFKTNFVDIKHSWRKKMKLVFAIFLFFIFPIALHSQVTYHVNTNSDSGAGSLRQAILDNNLGSGGGTILFDGNYTINLALGEMLITKPVTISGSGIDATIINGNNLSRIFRILSGLSVNISGMTIQNGKAPDDDQGGAILSGANLTLDKMKFSNNRVTAVTSLTQVNGGAISTYGAETGSLLVTNSFFENNTVMRNLSDQASFGGAIASSVTAEIRSTQFTNNISGGGSYVITNPDNSTTLITVGGGAVYAARALTLADCTFSSNKAGFNSNPDSLNYFRDAAGNGGAVVAMDNLTLSGNMAFQNNEAGGHGGAIYKSALNNFVTGSPLMGLNITGNKSGMAATNGAATNIGSGGGIYTLASLSLVNANNVSITGNYALGFGGGIYLAANTLAATLTLDNIGLMTNNSACVGGGAVGASGLLASVTLKDVTISGNRGGYNGFTKKYDPYTPSVGASGGYGGGGVSFAGNSLTLIGNILLQRDTVAGYGGAFFYAPVGSQILNTSSLSSFTATESASINPASGTVTSNGGGIAAKDGAFNLTATNNIIITNNSAYAYGGGIYSASALTLNSPSTVISDNKGGYDVSSSTYLAGTTGDGGGLYANSNLTLAGSVIFKNNKTGRHGGAILKNASGSFTVTGLTSLDVYGNRAGLGGLSSANNGAGGGIYTGAPLTLTSANNATINNNHTFGPGGGINSTSSLTLNNINSISGNTATVGGGGINASGGSSSLTLIDMTISDNKAGYNIDTNTYLPVASGSGGGGVSSGGSVTLSGNIVLQRDTVAGYGGALFLAGSTFNSALLTSMTISENASV